MPFVHSLGRQHGVAEVQARPVAAQPPDSVVQKLWNFCPGVGRQVSGAPFVALPQRCSEQQSSFVSHGAYCSPQQRLIGLLPSEGPSHPWNIEPSGVLQQSLTVSHVAHLPTQQTLSVQPAPVSEVLQRHVPVVPAAQRLPKGVRLEQTPQEHGVPFAQSADPLHEPPCGSLHVCEGVSQAPSQQSRFELQNAPSATHAWHVGEAPAVPNGLQTRPSQHSACEVQPCVLAKQQVPQFPGHVDPSQQGCSESQAFCRPLHS